MKAIIPLFLFLFFSCASVPKVFIQTDDICHYDDSIFNVTKQHSDFSNALLVDTVKQGRTTIMDNDTLSISLTKSPSGFIWKKITNKTLNIGCWITYYKTGEISNIKYVYTNGHSPLFKESHFDEQGNITKVIDYEKGYNICWAEAIEIVKKKERRLIEKYQITEFYAVHNDLNEFPDAPPVWVIGLSVGNEDFMEDKRKNGTRKYRVDGVTGKILGMYRSKSYPS